MDTIKIAPEMEPIMQFVRLLTRDGREVHTGYVIAMNPPPEIICWGERFFIHDMASEYREGIVSPLFEVGTLKVQHPSPQQLPGEGSHEPRA